MTSVAVVIPYYQERPGILARAFASIVAQTGVDRIQVMVVDDGSPVPAYIELPVEAIPDHISLRIIVQRNQGPARARNAALAAIGDDVTFIAFLDSDDEWLPTHLGNAIAALGQDRHFYFANYREPGELQDAFGSGSRLRLGEHLPLPDGSNCHEYRGSLAWQIISANVIETSTVVFRRSGFADLRFREDYSNAFEDHLFWLSIADRNPAVAFSWEVECQYGLGVNVWRGTRVGSPRALRNLLAQCRYIKEIQQRADAGVEAAVIAAKRRSYRECFVAECAHRLRRGETPNLHDVFSLLREDPALAYEGALIAGRALLGKLAASSVRN